MNREQNFNQGSATYFKTKNIPATAGFKEQMKI